MIRRRFLAVAGATLVAGCFDAGASETSEPNDDESNPTNAGSQDIDSSLNCKTRTPASIPPHSTEVTGRVNDVAEEASLDSHVFEWNTGDNPQGWVVGTVTSNVADARIEVDSNFIDSDDVVFEENYTVLSDIQENQAAEFEVGFYTEEPDRLSSYEVTLTVFV